MRTGLDLAKNIFEVYGVDEHEQPALRKTLKRSHPSSTVSVISY
jgi:transposase